MNENTYSAEEVANLTGFDDQKLGIGPVIEVPDWFAQLMTRLGMAVEVADDKDV